MKLGINAIFNFWKNCWASKITPTHTFECVGDSSWLYDLDFQAVTRLIFKNNLKFEQRPKDKVVLFTKKSLERLECLTSIFEQILFNGKSYQFEKIKILFLDMWLLTNI